MNKTSVAVAAFALMTTMAGCSTASPQPEPTTTVTATETVKAETTPTPSADPKKADEAFLQSMRALGSTLGDTTDKELLEAGHEACETYDYEAKKSPKEYIEAGDYSSAVNGTLITASLILCPENRAD